MRRLLVVLAMALFMAAMMVAMAMPAFAAGTCRQSSLPILECSGGSGEGGQGGGGGGGGHFTRNVFTFDFASTGGGGGGGQGGGGGGGGNCSGNPLKEVEECKGGGSS